MKKILIISHSSDLYGAERSLLSVLRHINKEQYEPYVVFPRDGELKDIVEQMSIKTFVLPMMWWAFCPRSFGWGYFRRLLFGLNKKVRLFSDLIMREGVQIVYTNTVVIGEGAVAAKRCGLPHVWHIHEILRRDHTIRSYVPLFLMKRIVNFLSAKIIVPSRAARQAISYPGSAGKLRIIPNGLDVKEAAKHDSKLARTNLRLELGISEESKIIGCIGSFSENKGQEYLVRAAQIILQKHPLVVFVFAGGGDSAYISRIKDLVKALGLEKNIHFLGFRKDVYAVLHAVDMLVSPSLAESFGMTLLEAISCGKPVIATRSGGSEDIIVDGKTGILVPQRTAEEIAKAIMRLLEDPGFARTIAESGRKRAIEAFNMDKCMKAIEGVLEEAVTCKHN